MSLHPQALDILTRYHEDLSKRMISDTFTGLERFLLRAIAARERLGFEWLKIRYGHRVRFGPGCSVSPSSFRYKGLGALEIGAGVHIDPGNYTVGFDMGAGAKVRIGADSWIQCLAGPVRFAVGDGASIDMGEGCWFTGGHLAASVEIRIGRKSVIAWGTTILDSSMHAMDNDRGIKTAPVLVGNHVWIAANCTLLPGVAIGDHCVIGTGSLINSDIPPNTFAAGRPARPIRTISDRDRVG